jgi:hypothetical protein
MALSACTEQDVHVNKVTTLLRMVRNINPLKTKRMCFI